jgi:hypothetical protein
MRWGYRKPEDPPLRRPGSRLIRLSAKDIGRRQQREDTKRLKRAKEAAKIITPDISKRWKRIWDAGAHPNASELQDYFDGLSRAFGRPIAIDLFEHVIGIGRAQNPAPARKRGRPAVAVDDARDKRIRATFNADDPKRP